MKKYRVTWGDKPSVVREATDMHALLTAMLLGERKPEPTSIELVK